jgi:hypothetical protein
MHSPSTPNHILPHLHMREQPSNVDALLHQLVDGINGLTAKLVCLPVQLNHQHRGAGHQLTHTGLQDKQQQQQRECELWQPRISHNA